jgi:transcription elongation factor GreA
MDGDKEYLTKEKFKELGVELDQLQTVRRKEVAEHLEHARSLGDLSENAEYHEARDEQAKVEARILQLKDVLKNAEIVSKNKSGCVEVGCTITVKDANGDKFTYQIVGSEEADITKNKISNQSPFGQAMLGKEKGNDFEFQSPKGKVKYTIVDCS